MTPLSPPRPPSPRSPTVATSSLVRGGLLGAVPGALIVLVPLVLHGLDVISADQSQIGFAGIPVLLIGTFLGLGLAAGERATPAVIGAGAGFVAGLAGGVALGQLLRHAGSSMGGLWLVLAPIAMIFGAVVAVRLTIRTSRPER